MKIGFVGLPVSGHVNPMVALARVLNQRGHEAVYFGPLDLEPAARAAGVTFVPFGEKEYPIGSIPKLYAPVAKLHGLEAAEYAFAHCSPGLTQAAFDYLPQKLKETGIEMMAVDTAHSFVELVPLNMDIPYVQIWNIIPFDFSGTTPICLYSWPNDPTREGLLRNLEGLPPVAEMVGHVAAVAKSYAEKIGLQIDWANPLATASKLATISQTPKEFDLPGIPWPNHFHYTGPFHNSGGREPVPFPWEQMTGKPLIYASLGTLVNGIEDMYRIILEATRRLPETQVVLSVGDVVDFYDLGPIPSNAIIVRRAPQIELLKHAALCITHAGLNTALESLAQGVPMVAMPIAFDQPGVAARIAHYGVGEFLEGGGLTADRLFEMVQKVLDHPSYRDKARHFQRVIAKTRGLDAAADVLEQAFQTANDEAELAQDVF